MKCKYIYRSIPALLFCSATALCATGITTSPTTISAQTTTSTQSLSGRNTCSPVLPDPLLQWAQPGDIIYESSGLDNLNHIFGHICIVVSVDRGRVMIVEAVPPRVRKVQMTSQRFIDYHDVLLRPALSLTDDDRNAAIGFIKDQVYKPYSFDYFTHDDSHNRKEGNCAELAGAGYRSVKLDMCDGDSLLVDREYVDFNLTRFESKGMICPAMVVDSRLLNVITDGRHL